METTTALAMQQTNSSSASSPLGRSLNLRIPTGWTNLVASFDRSLTLLHPYVVGPPGTISTRTKPSDEAACESHSFASQIQSSQRAVRKGALLVAKLEQLHTVGAG